MFQKKLIQHHIDIGHILVNIEPLLLLPNHLLCSNLAPFLDANVTIEQQFDSNLN